MGLEVSEITWACHVCGEDRPDPKISVENVTRNVGGVPIPINVRYCNDRPGCKRNIAKANILQFGDPP